MSRQSFPARAKPTLAGWFVGQVMQATGGKANPQAVNEAFFPDGRYAVNFIINLGVADHAGTFPRGPRLAFDDVAQIV